MSIEPREIWRKAAPLDEAWLEYSEAFVHSSFQYKRKFEALGKKPKKGNFENQKGSIYEDFEPKDLDSRWQRRLKLIAGLRSNLLAYLRSGELIAFGFMISPEIKADPQKIPEGLFLKASKTPDAVNWEDGIIDLGATQFEKVRVLQPGAAEAVPSRPRGRPSKATGLKAAVAIAHERDPGFSTLTVKQARPVVTTILKNVLKIPDAQAGAFSDETLRRVIKGLPVIPQK